MDFICLCDIQREESGFCVYIGGIGKFTFGLNKLVDYIVSLVNILQCLENG